MVATLLEPVLHAAIALSLLAAYCTLWALGHQDTTLLGILAGQLGALGISHVAQQAAVANGSKPSDVIVPPPPPPA